MESVGKGARSMLPGHLVNEIREVRLVLLAGVELFGLRLGHLNFSCSGNIEATLANTFDHRIYRS